MRALLLSLVLKAICCAQDFEIFEDQEPRTPNKEAQFEAYNEWQWSDQTLASKGILRMTDVLYDSQIESKPWLVAFVFDRFSPRFFQANKFTFDLIQEINANGFSVAFVDVVDEGELIKETLDVETTPSIIYINHGMAYHLSWNNERAWSANDVEDFARAQHLKEKQNYLRPRVHPGMQLYVEYLSTYVVQQGMFEDLFRSFISVKNTVKDWTGYEYDLKSVNREWGKKNRSKKAQVRTILEVCFWPAVALITLGSLLIAIFLSIVYVYCCQRKKE